MVVVFFLQAIGVVRMSDPKPVIKLVGHRELKLQLPTRNIIFLQYNYRSPHRSPLSMIGLATLNGLWSASIFALPNLYARAAFYIVPVVMQYNIEATVISMSVLL